jgi:hypothetical protein
MWRLKLIKGCKCRIEEEVTALSAVTNALYVVVEDEKHNRSAGFYPTETSVADLKVLIILCKLSWVPYF